MSETTSGSLCTLISNSDTQESSQRYSKSTQSILGLSINPAAELNSNSNILFKCAHAAKLKLTRVQMGLNFFTPLQRIRCVVSYLHQLVQKRIHQRCIGVLVGRSHHCTVIMLSLKRNISWSNFSKGHDTSN